MIKMDGEKNMNVVQNERVRMNENKVAGKKSSCYVNGSYKSKIIWQGLDFSNMIQIMGMDTVTWWTDNKYEKRITTKL